MKKILFLFAFYLLSPQANAQIQWQRYLHGSSSAFIKDVHQTADGGYIAVGYTLSNDGDFTGSHGGYDAFILKLSSSGDVEWNKCFGGSSNDYGYSVQQTADGGYILAGSTESSDGNVSGMHGMKDCWIVKLSPTGALIWQKCYGGSNYDEAYSIHQTKDGGYIVAAYTISNDGDVTGLHGKADVWVIKLSVSGNIEWQKTYGGSDYDDENNVSICQTFDGGYAFVTTTRSNDGDVTGSHVPTVRSLVQDYDDYWVVKLSAAGAIEWQKSLGGTRQDEVYSICQTFDSGYVLIGFTYSYDGDVTGHLTYGPGGQDAWVVKLSASGSIQWNKCVDVGSDEEGYSIQQTSDTGYIVCGYSNEYYTSKTGTFLAKLAANGSSDWAIVINSSYGQSVSQTKDGGYVVGGASGWIMKMGNKPSSVAKISNAVAVTIAPNPAMNELIISSPIAITDITICNMTGQTVYTNSYNMKEVRIDIGDLSTGMYLVRINNTEMRRFVKQ